MAAYNGTNFMVVGGMGPSAANSSGIATVAARYNANLNQWFPLAAVNPSSATINTTLNTLTFGVRATQISADELLILGGTLPNNHTVLPGWTQNVDVMASNGSWNQFVAEGFSLTGAAGPMRLLHHAMATGSDGQAYSFGGISPANASTNDYLDAPYINLNSTVVYHNSSIMAVNISGQAPTVRQMHTATALPTSQILIYGGFNDQNQVVSDTSYLYNIKSQSWEAVNLNGTGPGPRYGHSAVLVNDTLYIIGGVDSSGQARNDVSLLNVTSWTWVQNSGSDTNSSNDNGSHSLHGGAVAGVVIGVLVAVGLIAGGAFYFIRRRRLASEKTRFNSWSNTDVDSQTKEIRY
ncbi:hypothetical protein DM01DRAFT_1339924 [Hesseltinella vesiculosa]|uniref:Galactose oxidase n=1 Tax=Hesseltinella vesiculosa TaxID=101127 RepID=A0A1X2G5P0_9FUNG|nr:hypothetical protein DM01DRAFT_1339924 [Hesseltinella vesiculosa]